jgi:hypothetical protein
LNNPLIATDPSGYIFWLVFAAAALTAAGGYIVGDRQFARAALGMAIGMLLGPGGSYGAAMTAFFGGSSFAAAVFAGFAAGGISSGNIQGAFRGALSAGLLYGAGSLAGDLQSGAATAAGEAAEAAGGQYGSAFSNAHETSIMAHGGIGRAGLHAIAGCVGALGGGKCGPGALSAGFAEFAGPKLDGLKIPGIVSRAIVGGIAAELGGGKFANGAMTASFGYLFNCLSHGCIARVLPTKQELRTFQTVRTFDDVTDWWLQTGAQTKYYDGNSPETQSFRNTAAVDKVRQELIGGAGHYAFAERYGFFESIFGAFKFGLDPVRHQVGGYAVYGVLVGDELRFTVHNEMSLKSLLPFLTPQERSQGERGGNVTQFFYWTEKKPDR